MSGSDEDDWRDDAACLGKPTKWWYPERGEKDIRARKVCAVCPVKIPCREAGAFEDFGIWGDMRASHRKAYFGGEWQYEPDEEDDDVPPDQLTLF